MEDSVEKSCWGVALKAVSVFAVAMFVAWLVSGAGHTAAVLAAAG